MEKEELKKWLASDGDKTNEAKRAFIEDFDLSAEQAVAIINILREGKDEPNEDALSKWYCYYWNNQDYSELLNVKDDLEEKIEKLKKDLWETRAKYLNICFEIYRQNTLDDVRELIDNALDLN